MCNILKRHSLWPVLLLLILFTSLSLLYSLILPLGEASDETHHFALVRFIAVQGRPPLTPAERTALGPKGDASPIYHSLVALLTQHGDISALPALLDAQARPERFIPADRRLPGQLLHTEDEQFPFRGIVLAWHLARLPSVLLGLATVMAVYLTVRSIYPERPYFSLAAASFVAFLPRFVISSAVVNDDNLAFPLITFAVYGLLRIAQGDERRRIFILVGGLIGLAAVAKYHSLVLFPEMSLVLIWLGWRNHWGWRTWLRRWGWSLLAFTLTSAWWFIFLWSRFSNASGQGWLDGFIASLGDPVVAAGFGGSLLEIGDSSQAVGLNWLNWAWLLFQTFWVEYGGLNIVTAPLISQSLGLLTLLALAGLLKRTFFNLPTFQPSNLLTFQPSNLLTFQPATLILALHLFLYLSLVIVRYLSFPFPETAQGRHLYPALVSIAFFGILGLSELWPGRLQRGWPRPRLDGALAVCVGATLLSLSLLTPGLFILPHYQPYLPITTRKPEDIPISQPLAANWAEGVTLAGFDLPAANTGEPLALTLYWQTGVKQDRDYLVRVCLLDAAGQVATCRAGHPVDGRYPMRAWETGYLVRDEIYLPTSDCLPSGDYQLSLSVLPLRRDQAATTVDETVEAKEPLMLDSIRLSAPTQASSTNLEIWLGNTPIEEGQIELGQIRQALTVIVSEPSGSASRPAQLISVGQTAPTRTTWPPVSSLAYRCGDGSLISTHNFIVDPSVSPGRYHLSLAEEIVSEPTVSVTTRPRHFDLPANLPTNVDLSFAGEMALLGYEVDLSPRRPGQAIQLKAYWQAQQMMGRNYVAILKLLDYNFTAWSQAEPELGGRYPTVLWAPGETVADVYELPLDRQTPAGLYQIEFSVLYDYLAGVFYFLPVNPPTGAAPLEHLYLGPIRVLDPAETAPPTHPQSARLGDQIELLGYDLVAEEFRAGQPLQLALHWRAISQPALDYTVFAQLISPEGLVRAQQDNQPQEGRYPTTAWSLQAKVVDRYTLTLAEGAPPGPYRLVVGMYDLATGQRLAAFDEAGRRWPDDAIELATVEIE